MIRAFAGDANVKLRTGGVRTIIIPGPGVADVGPGNWG